MSYSLILVNLFELGTKKVIEIVGLDPYQLLKLNPEDPSVHSFNFMPSMLLTRAVKKKADINKL